MPTREARPSHGAERSDAPEGSRETSREEGGRGGWVDKTRRRRETSTAPARAPFMQVCHNDGTWQIGHVEVALAYSDGGFG